MNYGNLFIFILTHVHQLGGQGRGVVIVRNSPLDEICNQFDEFLKTDAIENLVQYKKDKLPEFPDMIIYRKEKSEEHIVFGKSEQGWKGDYGMIHTDVVVSIH